MTATRGEPLPPDWSREEWAERRAALRALPRRVRVLLAAAWARSVLHVWETRYPTDLRPRKAIEAAEAWAACPSAAHAADAAHAAYAAAHAAAHAADAADAAHAATHAAYAAAYAADASDAAYARKNRWWWIYATYRRCRGPVGVAFDPGWRTTTAVALAREIRDGRRADLFPVLADALDDAGCPAADHLADMRHDHGHHTAADWAVWNLLEYGE